MSRLIRPLRQWPQLQHHHCCSRATLHHLLSSTPLLLQTTTTTTTTTTTQNTTSFSLTITSSPSSHRNVHHRRRALKHPNALPLSDSEEGEASGSGSDSESKKSRNQKKREARRAVSWGMQLAAFSTSQIKRILRLASLDENVLEALMLVKRLGPDVKEGKRRQFNYIGKLLRDVEPELMETLIQATKVGDHGILQALPGSKMQNVGDDNEEYEENENDEEEEVSHEYINITTRWFVGLINKDVKITNEVYSVRNVDFDRQELRRLVKRVHTSQEGLTIVDGNEGQVDAAFINAKKSLHRFLRTIAKRMPMNEV